MKLALRPATALTWHSKHSPKIIPFHSWNIISLSTKGTSLNAQLGQTGSVNVAAPSWAKSRAWRPLGASLCSGNRVRRNSGALVAAGPCKGKQVQIALLGVRNITNSNQRKSMSHQLLCANWFRLLLSHLNGSSCYYRT